jgi:hypothetical protein
MRSPDHQGRPDENLADLVEVRPDPDAPRSDLVAVVARALRTLRDLEKNRRLAGGDKSAAAG